MGHADDLTIIANSRNGLIETINKINMKARTFEKEIKEEKTKYMIRGKSNKNTNKYLTPQNYNFKTVTHFNYLGAAIEQKGKARVKERIMKETKVITMNREVLKNKNIIKKKNKINI